MIHRVARLGTLACAGLALVGVQQASAADTIGESYGSSGGQVCSYGGDLIQSVAPGNDYAAPYDGVITSWTNQGWYWQTVRFKVARLGSGGSYTVIGADGPRTVPGHDQRTTYPVRIPLRQGDVIGANIPNDTYYCPSTSGGGYSYGVTAADLGPGQSGFFDSTAGYQMPIEAQIERDGDGDGYGDETQDGCPTNASTSGPCPLPTVLGETFTPITSASTGTMIPALPADTRFTAPADGVITSWSYRANALVDGSAKLKVVRPLGGDNFQAVADSELRTPAANTLNTFATRLPVRSGDRIGIHVNNLPVASNVSANGSSWALNGSDLAPGTSATFVQSNRRRDVSAVLEADADGDGYGDSSQDQCPTDASTQGACPVAQPPPPGDDPACEKAEKKLKKAKAKLKKLKQKDAAAKQVKKAKGKVKKAKRAVKKAC